MIWILVVRIGLGAGTLGGIFGFGSTTKLMPFLVIALGPKAAVTVMAIAAVLGNVARVAVWWRIFVYGLLVGSTLMIGAHFAKGLMDKIDVQSFNWMMDALLLVAGFAVVLSAILAG